MRSTTKHFTSLTLAAAMMLGAVAAPTTLSKIAPSVDLSIINEIDANAASYSTGQYTVYVSSGVNVRTSYSTSASIVGAASFGRDCIITKVNGSWGYTSNIRCTNGWRSGWIYLPNLRKGWPAKIAASSLRLRKNPGSTASSNTVLTTIPRNAVVVITDARHYANSSWVKTTYNGKTGWMCFCDSSGNYAYGISDFGTEF